MQHSAGFRNVEAIARGLPGVEATTAWGQPALKVHGKMFACIASHKSAEPNTLMVRMDLAQRDALLDEEPGVYYLKEHYSGFPCVLVRLSRVSPDALRDLLIGAHSYVSEKSKKVVRPARGARGRESPRKR